MGSMLVIFLPHITHATLCWLLLGIPILSSCWLPQLLVASYRTYAKNNTFNKKLDAISLNRRHLAHFDQTSDIFPVKTNKQTNKKSEVKNSLFFCHFVVKFVCLGLSNTSNPQQHGEYMEPEKECNHSFSLPLVVTTLLYISFA